MNDNHLSLTIVIPTRNRQHYLSRVVEYYSNFNFQIIICDSSESPYDCTGFPNTIAYKHFPGYVFADKLKQVLNEISTKYTVLCADDDFVIQNSLNKCIKFLNANKDYTSVQGQYITILYYDNNRKTKLLPRYLNSIGVDINADNYSDRMRILFSNYVQLFYSVYHTHTLQDIFTIASESKLRNLNLLEIEMAFVAIIKGKHKVLPIFYGAREEIGLSAGSSDNIDIVSTDEKYKVEYEQFLKSIAQYINRIHGVNVDKALEEIEEYIQLFINFVISKNNIKLAPQNKAVELIKKAFPKPIRTAIGKTIYRIKYVKPDKWYLELTRGKEGFPFFDPKYQGELSQIERLVKEHLKRI